MRMDPILSLALFIHFLGNTDLLDGERMQTAISTYDVLGKFACTLVFIGKLDSGPQTHPYITRQPNCAHDLDHILNIPK